MAPSRGGALVDDDDPLWVRFWNCYPKRVNKKDARKAWAEINPTVEQVERMERALGWQCYQASWLKDGGQFIPYPASWLRAERWDDEPVGIPLLNERTARHVASAEAFVAGGGHGTH